MDAPTPITTEPAETTPPSTRRTRRRVLAAAGLAGTVAVAGIGFAGLRTADGDATTPNRSERSVADLIASTQDDLGDVRLDDLAEQLADLGLEITISPSEDGPAVVGGSGDEDAPDTDTDGADTDTDTDTDTEDVDDSGPLEGDEGDDPFAGMTDTEIDALSDEEFFALLEEAGWTVDEDGWIVPDGEATAADDHGDHDHDHEQPAFDETAAVFTVDGDSIAATSGESGAVAEAQAIWARFVELIPADQRSMLVGFELMAERGGGGYVYPDENDPTTWHMGISPGLGADEDFVLIHEFAHLLTLQAKEVPPGFDDGACPTYHTGEGCSLKGSTMADFVARFWPKAQQDEVFAAQEAEDYDALDAFYAEHQDDFVTDYATTNPAEDLAETFTVFVLNDRPTGDTIADQKVQFLWNDPDMVELRERIRAAL